MLPQPIGLSTAHSVPICIRGRLLLGIFIGTDAVGKILKTVRRTGAGSIRCMRTCISDVVGGILELLPLVFVASGQAEAGDAHHDKR